MSITDDFTVRFSGEFSPESISDDLPKALVSWPAYYGGTYTETVPTTVSVENEIILNLIAHLTVVEGKGSNSVSKELSSRGVGPFSSSYNVAAPDRNKEFFSSTKYGQRYVVMTSPNFGGIFV